MAEIKEIRNAMQRKKRNRTIRRICIVVILLALVVAIILNRDNLTPDAISNWLSDSLSADSSEEGFPVGLPSGETVSLLGVGENVALFIKCLHDLCTRCEVEPPKRQPLTVKVTYAEFWTLLDGIYRHETKEVVDVYLLDSTSEIFACQRLAEGEVSSVEFTANALAKIIIDDSPAGLFIVHNHPHGTTKPSKADKQVTKKCQLLYSLHNVMFCDHIIYARGQIYSYYESGKMQPISMNFAVKTVLEKEEEENGV